MFGGDFNRGVGLTYRGDAGDKRYILRVPRCVNEWLEESIFRDEAEIIMWTIQ